MTTAHRRAQGWPAYDAGTAAAVAEQDRQYFAAHPQRSSYTRQLVAGEYDAAWLDDYPRAARVTPRTHHWMRVMRPEVPTDPPARILMARLRERDYPTHQIPDEHVEAILALCGGGPEDVFTVEDDDDDESDE